MKNFQGEKIEADQEEEICDDQVEPLKEQSFREFCGELKFDPFHPEEENEIINFIISKGKNEGITEEVLPSESTVYSSSSDPMTIDSSDPINNNPEKRQKIKSLKSKSRSSNHEDPRRDYISIFTRAFNTYDMDILEHCVKKYCTPDCVCSYNYVGVRFPYGCENIHVMGIEAMLKFWEALCISQPDGIFRTEEHKFRTLSNGSCVCISKYIYHCTKIFWKSTDEFHKSIIFKKHEDLEDQDAQAIRPWSVSNTFPESPNIVSSSIPKTNNNVPLYPLKSPAGSSIRYGEQQYEFPNIHLPDEETHQRDFGLGETLEPPVRLIFIGTFTLFINSQGKIYKFEFLHSLKA